MSVYIITAQAGIGGLARGMSTNMAGAFANASRGGLRGANNLVSVMAEGFAKNLGNPADMRKAHSEVAALMRTAVINSFNQTVKTRSGQYREGQNRISGGILRDQLSKDSMAEGTESGINFVDEDRLDDAAAHWRRLNFGAVGTAITGRTAEDFPFIFDDRILFRVGFKNPASDPFGMPPGRWMKDGRRVGHRKLNFGKSESRFVGGDQFWPGGGGRKGIPRTRGIRPRSFLDAGLRTMVEQLPPRYELLADVWLARADASTSLPRKVVVRTGRNALGQFTRIT